MNTWMVYYTTWPTKSAKKSLHPLYHRSQLPRSTKLPCNVKCIGTIARVAGPRNHAETITGRLNHPHLGTANTQKKPQQIRSGCLAVWKFNRETLGPIGTSQPVVSLLTTPGDRIKKCTQLFRCRKNVPLVELKNIYPTLVEWWATEIHLLQLTVTIKLPLAPSVTRLKLNCATFDCSGGANLNRLLRPKHLSVLT